MEFLLMLAAACVLAWFGAGWLDDYEERLTHDDQPEGRASGKRTREREQSESS